MKTLLLSNNLNNLHLLWLALGGKEQNKHYLHSRWPHRQWRADFSLPTPPSSDPSQVICTIESLTTEQLSEHKLKMQQVVMSLPITSQISGKKHQNVEQLNHAEQLPAWTSVCSDAFNYYVSPMVISPLLADSNAYIFAISELGNICGTAIAFKTGDVLGIHLLGTAPKFQGQGIARKLMQHLIAKAIELDCNEISLQASQAGLRLYQQLGFYELATLSSFVAINFTDNTVVAPRQ
jgi:GNAT superfamily N-acetyltransferase